MTMELANLLESLRQELRATASPWRSRKGAAEYLGCSESLIDISVQKGDLPRHYLYGTPRFKVSDLDALVKIEKSALRTEGKP
jgi:hypothetical protein